MTTSDYLARRDGETMGQVYRFLGMSVGVVQTYLKEQARRQAYDCDVTYLSNQELGFDFLRDNLGQGSPCLPAALDDLVRLSVCVCVCVCVAMSGEQVVQSRPYHFCVVDEADSILIDEARTPLIISRKGWSLSLSLSRTLAEGA